MRKSYAKKTAMIGAVPGVAFSWNGGGESLYQLGELPKEIITQLAVHGLSQKLGDLSSKDEVNSVSEMKDAVTELWEALCVGQWNVSERPRGPMTKEQKIAMLEKQLAKLREAEKDAPPLPTV